MELGKSGYQPLAGMGGSGRTDTSEWSRGPETITVAATVFDKDNPKNSVRRHHPRAFHRGRGGSATLSSKLAQTKKAFGRRSERGQAMVETVMMTVLLVAWGGVLTPTSSPLAQRAADLHGQLLFPVPPMPIP